jgi:hypothetical protein
VVLIASLLAGVPQAGAFHDLTPQPEPAAKKKKKKKKKRAKRRKCKKTQVRVKIGKRRQCLSVKKALPAPKPGDQRALLARSAYKTDWSKLRNRRGKRAKSMPKLIRKLGRGAPGLLDRVTAEGLARIDGMVNQPVAARLRSRAWVAAAGCGNSPAAQQQSSYTSSSGGAQATATATLGPDGAALGLEMTGSGFTVKADFDFGSCEPNQVEAPDCPTAAGRLQGKIRYGMRVNVSVSKGGQLLWSQGANVSRTSKLDGFTEVDAKLDALDVEDEEVSTFSLGGSLRNYAPMTIRTRIIRNTRVDMRSGGYDPGFSDVTVTVTMDGLLGSEREEVQDDLERKARADATQQFRAIVDKAISGYRSREEAWQQANKCAKLEFNPAANSIRLRPGQTGSLTAVAKAVQDGGSSELDARLTSQENATFSPTRAGGQQARFEYTVSSGATGGKARTVVRATSKAGVAQDTWEEEIEPPFVINEIAGNFSGMHTQGIGNGTAVVTWNASGTFTRNPQNFPGATGNYVLTAGTASYHFSGQTITAHADCDMSGNAFVDLFQDGGGSIGVYPAGQNPFAQGPHNYGGDVGLGPDPKVTLTMSNCAPGAESENGKTYEYPVGFPPLDTGDNPQLSPDAVHYDGSHSVDHSGVHQEWTWALTGSE